MSDYFKIPITAGSEKELAQRIADLEARGFELVAIGKEFIEGKSFVSVDYKRFRKFVSNETTTTFKAVMRRPNNQTHGKRWKYY